MRLLDELEKKLSIKLSFGDFMRHASLERLTKYLNNRAMRLSA
ncbi:MAG: acyl carrier protein [Limnobacter sp.]|nr:acyl carrier protein [Limnobacter sp.]